MKTERVKVIGQQPIKGGYRLLIMEAPGIVPDVCPGQFVHLRVPDGEVFTLRRPFSIFKAEADRLSLLYKEVGEGTRAMGRLVAGDTVSLLGPLGNGFPEPDHTRPTALVAGGYGMAALYLVAARAPQPGVVFVGGRTADDLLCMHEFQALGWRVVAATEDGSAGEKGLVTGPLDAWLEGLGDRIPELFACGPNGMLRAVAERAAGRPGCKAWLSMDRHMGCGVGACLTCVQRILEPDGTWSWLRVCKDGPVFEASTIEWDEEAV